MSLNGVEMFKKIKRFISLYMLPDSLYLKLKFRQYMREDLNLKKPETLNQFIQWMKINDRKPIYTILADKYKVRDYVKDIIGEEYLIPLVTKFDNENDIDISKFENSLPVILKPNHDSGMGVIIRSKSDYDQNEIKKFFKDRLSRSHYSWSKEYQYKNIPRKIVVEELLTDENGKIPNDLKFHCFHGVVEFIYVSIDREGDNYRKIFNRNWEPIEMTWCAWDDESKFQGPTIMRPDNLNEMIGIAEKLAKPFPYIRVDLYSVSDKIYFGEFTQHQYSGFCPIRPYSLDRYYGSLLDESDFK